MATKKINTDLQLQAKLLDISGSAGTNGQVLKSTGTSVDWVSLSEISGVDGTGTANYVTKWIDGDTVGNSLIYDNGTNIGIGTTAPSTVGGTAKLTIDVGTAYSTPISIVNGTTDGLYIRRYQSSGQYQLQTTSGATNSGTLSLQSYGGSVGIGTTSPASMLDVRGSLRWGKYGSTTSHTYSNIDGSGLYIETVGSTAALSDMRFQARAAGAGNYSRISIKPSNQTIELGTNSSLGLTINSSNQGIFANNVGIGTTSPTSKLHVKNVGSGEANSVFATNSWAAQIYNTQDSATAGGLVVGSRYANNDNIIFQVGNVFNAWNPFFTIKGGGNVGIGTETPSRDLHINSTDPTLVLTHSGGVNNANSGRILFGESPDYPDINTAHFEITYNGATNYLSFNSPIDTNDGLLTIGRSGYVGIGTTAPSNKLHVYGGRIIIDNTLVNQSALQFNQAGTEMAVLYRASGDSNQLRMFITGGGDVMSWNSAGNVGVGTTTPAQKLTVAGNTEITGTVYLTKGPSDTIQEGSSIYFVGGSGASYTQLQQGVGRFIVFGFNGSAWVERMTLNNTTGNVGIGTTTPGKKLTVLDDSTEEVAHFQGNGSKFIRVWSDDNAGNAGIRFHGAGDRGSIYGNNAYDMYIEPNAQYMDANVIIKPKNASTYKTNVGIGTTTPDATLEVYNSGSTVFTVNGSQGQLFSIEDDLTGTIFSVADISGVPIIEVEDTGVVTIDDTLNVLGDVTAYYSSDERLKDNIVLIENANEKVLKLRGVEFDWNSNSKHTGHDVGVIAQDVEKVLPELVKDRKNGYKGVDYQKIVALLIESNKELIKQNEILTQRVENLESKIQ